MSLDPIYQALGWLLAHFYAVVPNFGIGIILLTLIVMLVLFPLTAKQARSMLEMQRLQPEIKRLQAKHKGDRQKLNEEIMKLYQEHKVNPLGGCLPLVVQLPVFIALFRFLREAYKHIPTDSSLYKAMCGDHTGIKACGKAIAKSGFPGKLSFLGMDLSLKATDSHGSLGAALPYFMLVGLVVITGYLQSKQTQRNTPPGGQNTQMLIISKVFPIFFGVICVNFPSGVVLYWLTSNVWRLGQQELIVRKIAPREHVLGKGAKTGAGDGKGPSKAAKAESEHSAAAEQGAAAEPVGPEQGESRPTRPEAKPGQKRAAKPTPKPVASGRAARPASGGARRGDRPGGLAALRALFQPPPPPGREGDGPARSSPKPKPTSAGRATPGRSQRRRSGNKKRKR